MIVVEVNGSIDRALVALKRKVAADGITRELKVRNDYPKPSLRKRRKAVLALQRLKRKEKRHERFQ